MKTIYFLIAFLVAAPSAHAQMGGFGSLSEPEQNVLNNMVRHLGIADPNNAVKMRIFNSIDFVFGSAQWNSYLNYPGELSISNYKDEYATGFVTVSFNTSDAGIYFVTLYHLPGTEQIFLETKQLRYGSRRAALGIYADSKEDDAYRTLHDADTHALMQEDGYLNYQYFNVDSEHATVVYRHFRIIEI